MVIHTKIKVYETLVTSSYLDGTNDAVITKELELLVEYTDDIREAGARRGQMDIKSGSHM